MSPSRPVRTRRGLAALVVPVLVASGCSLSGGSGDSGGSSGSGKGSSGGTVTLLTHDSFALPASLQQRFRKDTGYTLKVVKNGDAGALTNKLVLTKGSPLGDAVFGIDNTFASRAVDGGVLDPHGVTQAPGASRYALSGAGGQQLSPVDSANVCLNSDTAWFTKHHLAEPQTFDDLTKPQYKGLTVVSSPATSSPGMAMLLATIGKYGQQGWQGYWKKLVANQVKVDSGWEQAYNVDFTGASKRGTRPVVLSYDTSPADYPSTKAMLKTCFRQVEYAGVVKGARNPEGAKALVRWLQSPQVQAALPGSMYVNPVRSGVALPTSWQQHVKEPTSTYQVAPEQITAHRSQWLQQWQSVTGG